MQRLVHLLIQNKGISGRFRDTVAGTLGAGILDEGRRVKARRRFGRWRWRASRRKGCLQTDQRSENDRESTIHGKSPDVDLANDASRTESGFAACVPSRLSAGGLYSQMLMNIL
jgi:hypothetical protein